MLATLAVVVVVIGSVAYAVYRAYNKAPIGYEDGTGFHFSRDREIGPINFRRKKDAVGGG